MKPRIDIVSGFLGAGKTTLILEMLKRPPEGERIAICENEFGEVGIDGEAFQGFEVVEINAGCVCCTLSFNLIAGLKLLIARVKPTRILLEPTGLASLADILNILHDDGLEKIADIGTPAAVIDAGAMLEGFERYRSYFEGQIGSARVLFLNRAEALDDVRRLRLSDFIEGINPSVRIVAEPFAAETLWEALDAPAGEAAASGVVSLPASWLRRFKQTAVPTGWRGSLQRLEKLIDSREYGEIIRAKGYVYDRDGARFRADFAGGRLNFEPALEGGPDFVQLIGTNLSAHLVRQFFESL